MYKKITFLVASAFLAAAGSIWAETVENANVYYEIGASKVTDNTKATTTINSAVKGQNASVIRISASNNLSGKKVSEVSVVPVSLKSASRYAIADWSEKNVADSENGYSTSDLEYTYSGNAAEYAEYGALASKKNPSIMSTADVSKMSSVPTKIYYFNSLDERKSASFDSSKSYYFLRVYDEDDDEYYYFRIREFDVAVSENKNVYWDYEYAPTRIDASTSLFKGNTNVTYLTIGASVTSIAEGAFAGATKLATFVSESTSFDVDANGLLYTAGYAALVAVPAGKKGTIALESNCKSIYDNAMANVSGVTLTSTQSSVSYTTLGGSNNKVLTAPANLAFSVGHNGMTATAGQLVNATNFKSFANKCSASTTFIDLSECIISEELSFAGVTLGANTLVFLPANTTISGTTPNNVVIDNKCNKLVLADATNFYSPYTFDVTEATLNRTVGLWKYATIVIPFKATLEKGWTGFLQGYENDIMTFSSTKGTMNAHVPYLLYNNGSADITKITARNTTVDACEGQDIMVDKPIIGTISFCGVENGVVSVTTQKNIYGIQNGELKKAASGANFKPFRAYFEDAAAAGAASYRIKLVGDDDEEDPVITIGSETGIEEVEAAESVEAVYDLTGNKVEEVQQEGLFIANGKKVFIKK